MGIHIKHNGEVQLGTGGGNSNSDGVSVHIPADIGTATLTVGWVDSADVFNPYVDGVMLAGEAAKFSTGAGVPVALSVKSFSTAFVVEVGT